MSKYVRVTHTYLVPMPDDMPDNDPVMETTINRGVSMMEEHILKLYENPGRCVDLHSEWKLVPSREKRQVQARQGLDFEKKPHLELLPPQRLTDKEIIEADLDQGVSFFDQEQMGNVPHPWDQGLWIFPEDHPARAVEEVARAEYEKKPKYSSFARGLKESFTEASKELESGEIHESE